MRYRDPSHAGLPHFLHLSGGRSSATLLENLLYRDMLRPERGDLVLFQNTSAEHPETYRFVARCFKRARAVGIPCLAIQWRTVEVLRSRRWLRRPSVECIRLHEHLTEWRGEVYEDLVSHKGMLPNPFNRICTADLKVGTSKQLIAHWLLGQEGLLPAGTWTGQTRIDLDTAWSIHRRTRGQLDRQRFYQIHRYAWNRPGRRHFQLWSDWTGVPRTLHGKIHSGQWVKLLGLRADERRRVDRLHGRQDPDDAEQIYTPLVDSGIDRAAVRSHWKGRPDDLGLREESGLGNCVYCFMKGTTGLRWARHQQERNPGTVPGWGTLAGTPCDLSWWADIEERYGRRTAAGMRTIGFLGARKPSYRSIEPSKEAPEQLDLGCVCTD